MGLFLLLWAVVLIGCNEPEEQVEVPQVVRAYKGDVQVINSCGINGAAAHVRNFLRKKGFDIVSTENDGFQNYDETIVVLRNPEWEGAEALAQALKTDNVLVVLNDQAVFDAAVYVGKNYKQIIEDEKGK